MAITEMIGAFILIAFIFYFNKRFKHWGKTLPPGPMGLPILGYLPFLDSKNPQISFSDLANKFGGIYAVQLGSIFTVVLSDVKLVRQALALDCFSGRAPLYLTHGIMKGNGIICVQGEKWKEQRKFVVGCLRNFGMVKFGERRNKMEADIKKGAKEMILKIGKAEGKSIDLENYLMNSIGNVVFNLVFGKTWEDDDETWKKLIILQEEGTKLIGVAGPINFLPFLRLIPRYKKIIEYLQNGINYTHDVYQNILREYRNNISEFEEISEGEERKSIHFLGAFDREMRNRKNEASFYTIPQFNYLMADLWGAGVDTTITTLRWFFLYISHHLDYQHKIQQQMDEVLGEKDITLGDIPSLPFLQASISEAQRIRSVTPLGIPHGTLEDYVLDGYHIPKGTMILPLQWAIHMNPNSYPEPDTYNPSRFIDSDGNFYKPNAFIPFQTGKRMCLGEEYAKMLLFLYGGFVLQNFRLELDGPVDFNGEVGITLIPKPHKIKFIPRKVQN